MVRPNDEYAALLYCNNNNNTCIAYLRMNLLVDNQLSEYHQFHAQLSTMYSYSSTFVTDKKKL